VADPDTVESPVEIVAFDVTRSVTTVI